MKLFDEFIQVLGEVENLILFKTYPAREKEIIGGSAEDISKALRNNNRYITNINDLIYEIKRSVDTQVIDCILVLGAGDLGENLRTLFKSNK